MTDSSSNIENPYAPPEASAATGPASDPVESARKCFRGMAWAGLLYPALSAIQLIDKTRRSETLKLLILQSVIMGLVAIFVVWISIRVRRDIDGTYRLARWTAIIGGAVFFPILTLPAFMAVSHLTEYRRTHSATLS